jgi:hypothetical protein
VEEKLPLDEESKIRRNRAKQVAGEAPVRGGDDRWRWEEREARGGRVGQLPSPPRVARLSVNPAGADYPVQSGADNPAPRISDPDGGG